VSSWRARVCLPSTTFRKCCCLDQTDEEEEKENLMTKKRKKKLLGQPSIDFTLNNFYFEEYKGEKL